MSTIYITGHRNPDLDTLCSACAYAKLKNQIDPDNEYIPIHCTPVSETIQKQMKNFDLVIPMYKADVHPRVKDVMLNSTNFAQADSPIYGLIQSYKQHGPSVLPLFYGKHFITLLSMDDISAFFLRDNRGEDPSYRFPVYNVAKTIPGKLIQEGKRQVIEGSLLAGAASKEAFKEFLDRDSQCIVFMGERSGNIDYAIKKQVPGIILTTIADGEELDIDFTGYEGMVYTTPLGTSEAIRRMRMVEPVIGIVRFKPEMIQANDLFFDAKEVFGKSKSRGMAVMNDEEFAGFVTRRCFLNAPKTNIIMVDHNEAKQSIPGIEDANIVEIIDHHRLDALSTQLPIFIAAEPLGSTCTIVFQLYKKYGITPDPVAAKYMLTGLMSDTLILRSPTTTEIDRKLAAEMAELAGVKDIEEFGTEMFSVVEGLGKQDPIEKAQADFKKYENGGTNMGVGQCEVVTLSDLDDYADDYLAALEEIRKAHSLDWVTLMVTDVLTENSILLVTDSKHNRDLPYKQIRKQIYDMPGVMSRKKQLLPALLSVTSN